ncbi:hypothetical protein [Francisella uliginis]|uniref:Uncharacterized protein n=1 Tax=Francisella uliginis TaxID=573570 RepID=A0A1L4BSJ9_9GAMM|nr:hypothetical protein [Francisella uliginis]API86808.1 hypothetical protein F7310_05315 [Francisella uliginis]
MINYFIAFVLAVIIYLVAIKYISNFCPVNKFFKIIIYICASSVSLPAVNYMHPTKYSDGNIISSLKQFLSDNNIIQADSRNTNSISSLAQLFSSTGDSDIDNDWQKSLEKAKSLVNTNNHQIQYINNNHNYSDNKTQFNQQFSSQSNYIIKGRDGHVID